MAVRQTVFVVDHDGAVHNGFNRLCETAGFACETYTAAPEFLEAVSSDAVGCLVLESGLASSNGVDLMDELRDREVWLPVVMVSGQADIPTAVRAMKAGAFDFLEKPCNEQSMFERVQQAIEHGERQRKLELRRIEVDRRIETLTPRERQVMEMVVNGMANKQVAKELGLSEKTIEVHRKHLMDKMRAGNVADLIRMAMRGTLIRTID